MRNLLRQLFVCLFLFLFWPFFLIKKYGKKDVDFLNNSLIIANHYSNLDPFYIYLLVKNKKRIYFITNEGVKNNFFTRNFTKLFNCLYVSEDNNASNFVALKKAIKVLKEGAVVVIFPEGFIRPVKNGFFDFNEGFVFLARKAKSNIYPLFIYPEPNIFKRTKVYINDCINIENLKDKDDTFIAMYFQSIVIESSFKIERDK